MMERTTQGQAIFPGATGNASDQPGNMVLSGHRRRGEVAGEIRGEGFINEPHARDRAFRERLAAATRGNAPAAAGGDAVRGAPDAAGGGDVAAARKYLLDTATPGGTMSAQGAETAIARLHPEMALRLAGAVREARAAGMSGAGVYSAFRTPSMGANPNFAGRSLHGLGAAVDMTGIGRPGSAQAKQWYEIATRHGLHNPYGPEHSAEWNHYQLIRAKESPITIPHTPPADVSKLWSATGVPIPTNEGQARFLGKSPPAAAGGLGWTDKSGRRHDYPPGHLLNPIGPRIDAAQRAEAAKLDEAQRVQVEGKGSLDVNVNAPEGTSVKANGEGLFRKTTLDRQTQMEPTKEGPPEPAGFEE